MDKLHEISLRLPAAQEDLLVARMALSGLGMLVGLDADMIGDLRTVVNECCDCLIHQAKRPQFIRMEAETQAGRLLIRFLAEGDGGGGDQDALDLDVTRGILETLMPEVALQVRDGGVCGIQCSMPV